jgi:hypothetical protein
VVGVSESAASRYELAFFVGPDTEAKVMSLAEAIMALPEYVAVGGGGMSIAPQLCACGTPTVVCECGDDRCPKCDPNGCPA